MIHMNYYKQDGRRSCISLTDAQIKAADFICKRKKIKSRSKYIFSIINKLGDVNNISGAIRDQIILELLKMIGG